MLRRALAGPCCAAVRLLLAFSVLLAGCSSGGTTAGGSNPVQPQAPVPVIASVSPGSATVGSAATTVTLTGQNFVSSSVVYAGSSALSTTYVSGSSVQAVVPASMMTSAGNLSLTATNTAGTSTAATFSVTAPPGPTITSLSPSSARAGSVALSMTVTGQNYVSGSVVTFNGTTLVPVSVSATQITVTVPDALLATAGSYNVVVIAPGTGGGPTSSPAATFTVNPLPTGQFVVNLTANDIASDPVRGVIYASVPSTGGTNGNSVVTIDETTGAIVNSVFVGSEPDLLAVSADGQYLYVALDGSSQVKRYVLPDFTADFTVSLGADAFFGPNTALDLGVSPTNPHVWAVTSGNLGVSPAAQKGVQLYDDAIARGPSVGRYSSHGGFDLLLGTIVWGKDATVLYGANNESTGFDLFVLPITSAGVGTITDYGSAMSGFNNAHIHFDGKTGLVYGDNGYAVDPTTGSRAGQFACSGPMVPDGGLNAAFFVNTTPSSGSLTMASFDMTRYTPLNIFSVPPLTGTPRRMMRWGANGVAFNTMSYSYSSTGTTKTGKVFVYAGPFVKQ